jgi:S-formylglutathione hydrolase FrmB
MMIAAALALAVTLALPADTARESVRNDSLWSQSLGVSRKLLVYLPPSYDRQPDRRYPVAFYLHGAWGSEGDWVRQGRLDRVVDSLVARGMTEMIVVMPDGDDGWYTTWNALNRASQCRADTLRAEPASTYCVTWPKYDEYIARDVVAHVDSSYRTLADPAHRGVAGLSMGGYGAITLALRYPDVFQAAASHSGVLSPRYAGTAARAWPLQYAASVDTLRQRYGRALFALMDPVFGSDTTAWRARDPVVLLDRLIAQGRPTPALFVDIGRDDTFLEQNRAFRLELERRRVALHYVEHPGTHNWKYWQTHVAESLLWLSRQIGGSE